MRYRMRDNLSYCVIDGHAVFLDIEADRYFCLPERLERDFVAYASASDCSGTTLKMLVEHNILTPERGAGRDAAPTQISAPRRSAQEMRDSNTGIAMLAIPEVAAAVLACRRRIRTKAFKDILDRTVRFREQRCLPPTHQAGQVREWQLLQATSVFRRARMYVPIATCCLLDSLALSGFLARRHFRSNIVFGVTYEPFSAHCWVQSGDIALNETVGNAMAHTIIKVV